MNSARWSWAPELPPSQAKYEFASIGKDCVIWPGAKIIGANHINLGNAVMIDDLAFLNIKALLVIGDFVHIAPYGSITGGEYCEIGAFTSLSWGVRVFTSTENLGRLFGPMIPSDLRELIEAPVRIGKHVLIGANSVILPGAVIGEGAVIGASSVVRKNEFIWPWRVWGGVPAQFIKEREKEPILEAERELRDRYYKRFGAYIGQV